jgi:hypothetical protein
MVYNAQILKRLMELSVEAGKTIFRDVVGVSGGRGTKTRD